MKNIFKFAIEFEQENQKFYNDCAAKANNKKLKQVFNRLAEEEKKHEEIIRDLAKTEEIAKVESDIVNDAKEVFTEVTKDFATDKGVLPEDQLSVYKEALELESKSHDYYKEKAAETDDELVKVTFEKLAIEEKKHENIMHNLVTMVERPKTWLEDAEWYHHQDY